VDCLRQKLHELETSSSDSRNVLQAQFDQRDETIQHLQRDFASLQEKRDWYHSEVMMLLTSNFVMLYSTARISCRDALMALPRF